MDMKDQPRPARATADLILFPRMYAQSALGQVTSQGTCPPDSRSIEIANSDEQGRVPYATLLMCPTETPQRDAKSERCAVVIPFQKALKSMHQYHHTGIVNATPNGDFTKWCMLRDNIPVTIKQLRINALRKWIDNRWETKASRYAEHIGMKQSQLQDMLDGRKSFGERVAARIEKADPSMPAGYLVHPKNPDAPSEVTQSYHGIQLTRAGALLGAEWEKLDIDERIEIENEIQDRVAGKVREKRKAGKATANRQRGAKADS